MFRNYLSRILVLLVSLVALQVQAHHSRSGFDQNRTIEVRGVVVDFKMRSPHSSMVVDGIAYVNGERQSQNVERWEWESEAVPVMVTQGYNSESFKPGDAITLTGRPHRDPDFKFAMLGSVISVNGEAFSTQSGRRAQLTQEATSQGGAPSAAEVIGVDRIAGIWSPRFIPAGIGSNLPLNQAGVSAWENYDPRLSPANTCESMTVPEIFHAPFYLYKIEFTDEAVVLTTEAYEIQRTVLLNGEQVPADTSGLFGKVRGNIENDTLVIESSDFPASLWGLGAATQINGGGADVPSSDQKTLLERYSVSADGRTLIYEYTMNDPVYLLEPYEFRIEFLRLPDDTPMYPYKCDLESASMFSRSSSDAPIRIGD